MPSGRFSHSAAYVSATIAHAGLVNAVTDPIVPRLECGEPVRGLLVVAGYANSSGARTERALGNDMPGYALHASSVTSGRG